MTDEQLESLIRRLEPVAIADPGGYQLRVLALAALGNAYIAAMLALIVALLGGLVASLFVLKALAVKLILVVGFFLWMILKALWVKLDPPEGTEITAAQAPDLFRLIESLRRDLGAPRFDHVLVDARFNAAVAQMPRFGIFGGSRNYLLLGLPLMKSLGVEQFKAVLAHEFGHLAKGHGRVSNWIYRQRLRWTRLLVVLSASESRGSFLFKPFLKWFAPYFNAYSFPMARANEYTADATSARLTSARKTAEALTASSVVGSFLASRYWPGIHKKAEATPTPSFMPYSGLAYSIAKELDVDSARTWLEQALNESTDLADTHPSLGERLKAIGEPPCWSPPADGEAADRLLGSRLESITEDFDRRWQQAVSDDWKQHHREVQEGRTRLAELDRRCADGEELGAQDAYDRARLTESIGNGSDAALVQFRHLHERFPDDPVVCFSLGTRLLARDDDAGHALLDAAALRDPASAGEVARILGEYHRRHGRAEEARAWLQRAAEQQKLHDDGARERNRITLGDKFVVPDLPDDQRAELAAALRRVPGLRKAYLVRKIVRHQPDRPCYILGYRVTAPLRLHSDKRAQDVLARIRESVQFPGYTLIISVEGANYRFGRKFAWMKGTRIV